ncbi:TonB-dependent receptor [Novosphingobium umbonatum]|uniref:TonB-dependent receptor n=1 Tax=Novosphingobium umbonatum TaxID=1908524 RepID=A0A437NCT9_9SPHN|nr:TonB-dependent receptor [Novosphingobium umbonatum]
MSFFGGISVKHTKYLQASLAGVLALASGAAYAQAAPAADNTTQDIVVTGLRASLRDAINAKRAAMVVTETISSKDIGVLPDVTIADSLARLPGVTATRDRGNASQASVRGLGPRLVLGLVNGREVASSEPDRNVRWEIYPSEAVSGVTVYKSQGADLIAGGVAATIDIRTIRPLDYSGPKLTARAGAQMNDPGFKIPGYDTVGTRGSLQYVTRLSDNLGLALGGSYQQQKNGYASFQGWGYNNADAGNSPPTYNGQAVYAPWGAQTEVKALKETRWSTTGALQWKDGDHWDASLDVLYSNVKINEKQFQQWFGGWGDWGGTIPDSTYQAGKFTLAGRDIVGATVDNWKTTTTNVIAKYVEDKTLFATGFNTRYRGEDVTVKFDGSYSQALRKNTWSALEWVLYPQSVTFNTAANVVPSITTPVDLTAASAQSFAGQGLTGPQRLQDTLGAAQVDLQYKLHGGIISSLNAGLRFSNRVKSFDSQTGGTVSVKGTPAFSSFSTAGGGFTAPNMLYADYDAIAALNVANTTRDKSQFWRVREDNFEGYVQAELLGNAGSVPFYGNVGVRFIDVTTHSGAYQGVTQWDNAANANVTSYNPVNSTNHYFRALPSLNLNFDLQPTLKLRAGVARVMARPPLDELRASQNLSYYPSSGYLAGSAGNPSLKPFMATQGDLSLEWYFHKDAVVALAGYYKDVSTSIGYTTYPVNIGGTTYQITGPANGKGGYVAGTEVSLSTPFWFVPALEKFGVYANVALLDSNLRELSPVSNPFPAVGLTAFTGQLDLWYSDHGIDARVGLKRHSPQTVIFGWDASKLTRLQSETNLGVSVSYAITKAISLRVQANNLTNQAARFYYANDPNQLARYEKYGPSYLADVTVKF